MTGTSYSEAMRHTNLHARRQGLVIKEALIDADEAQQVPHRPFCISDKVVEIDHLDTDGWGGG